MFGNKADWIAEGLSHAFESFRDVDLDVRTVRFSKNGIEPQIQSVVDSYAVNVLVVETVSSSCTTSTSEIVSEDPATSTAEVSDASSSAPIAVVSDST